MENDVIGNTTDCPSCHTEMAITDKFCHGCGQKVQRKIPKLGELISEFFDSVLNIDSKIILTFRAIFIPAQLTIQYFKGIRKKYYHPFRLFFFVSVLFFSVLGLTGLKNTIMELNENNSLKKIRENAKLGNKLDEVRGEVSLKFQDTLMVGSVFDTLKNELKTSSNDTINIKIFLNSEELNIATNDLLTLSGEEIIEKYAITGFWNQLFAKQMIKITQDPSGFTWYMIGNLIWMLILLMPAVALVLKLFYIRRKRYFVEHLTFLFHFHSFAFFISALSILAVWYFQKYWIYGLVSGGVLIYLYIAMKRYYKQGWFKTFIKFSFLGFSYFFLALIFFIFMTLISLAMF